MTDTVAPTIASIKASSLDREVHWLVEQQVKPELPQLIEALQICLNLLLYNSPQHPDPELHIERGPSITLAVSLGKLDALKGILVRDGAYVTKMTLHLKERHFNRVLSRVHLVKPFLLRQIITAKRSIDNAVALLVQAASVFDQGPCLAGSHVQLVEVFSELLRELQTAKHALQLPTDPTLVFPLHALDPAHFEPPLLAHIALDVYISQAEVCVDLKDLHSVTEKPWGDVDAATGKLYVDKIRDRMSAGHVDKHDAVDRGVLDSVFSTLQLRPKYDVQDYITRCVTYNGGVVMVNKKIEVLSADPVLVSAFTKLDSVEYMVSSFMENIQKLM